MAGVNQLPAGSEYAAAIAMTYSVISWICSSIFIWLTWVHRERRSHIAILSYFTLLSTTASIIQQIHDITWYRDIMIEQFHRQTAFVDNPELAIANGSFGLDLALYYIQYYSYSVEAMLVMFWAGELAQSIYGMQSKASMRRILRKVNAGGKAVSVLLPLVTILLLRAPQIQKEFVVFILLADLPLMISLAIGSSTMIAILVRYVKGQKKFSQWKQSNHGSSYGTGATSETEGVHMQSSNSQGVAKRKRDKAGLFDRWLMVRFTFAFVVLAHNREDSQRTEPDLSAERARATLFLFMPGVTAGIFVFVIFGTTASCRKKMRDSFLPKRWNIGHRRRRPWLWKRVVSGVPVDAERGANPFASVDDDGAVGMSPIEAPRGEEKKWKPVQDEHGAFQSDVITPYAPSQAQIQDQASRTDHNDSTKNFSKPLPQPPTGVVAPVSRYNRSFNRHNDRPRQNSVYFESGASEHRDYKGTRLRGMRSLDQIHEEYYASPPDHSDDSGPILPIQSPLDSSSGESMQRRPSYPGGGRKIQRKWTH